MDLSLEEKKAFFDELDALNGIDDDDELPRRDIEFQALSRNFFKPQTQTASSTRGAVNREGGPAQSTGQPATARGTPTLHPPRRTFSVPTPRAVAFDSPVVIKATPVAARGIVASKYQITSTTSFVEETPIPDSTRGRPPHPLLQRSATAPLPLPPSAAPQSTGGDMSPSVNPSIRKRKRQPTVKVVPQTEQIFNGLSFYYLPNDDVAPARKLRIMRAQEYGARWVRELSNATHIVVDKRLGYKDVEKILPAPAECRLVVVNEEYPIDCISFKALLNPSQPRYKVAGFPDAAEITVSSFEPAGANNSLPLKEPQGKRALASENGTSPRAPSPRDEAAKSSQARSRSTSVSEPAAPEPRQQENSGEHNSGSVIAEPIGQPPEDAQPPLIDDELSEYIQIMRQYKDLPLDEDEDDSRSVSNSVKPSTADSEGDSASDQEQDRKKRLRSAQRGKKNLNFEEQFACSRGGTLSSKDSSQNPNARTIEVLQSLLDYYTRTSDQWRTLAYRKAINTLRRQPKKILTSSEAYKLPNIGQRIADKIEEIVTTNALRRLDYTHDDPLDQALSTFLGVYGVGTAIASRWLAQGFRTLDDLLSRATDLTPNQRLGIERYDDFNTRIPRAEVSAIGSFVKREAAKLDPAVELVIGGSYRRGSPSSGDVDFIVTKKGTTEAMDLVPFLEDLVLVLEQKGFLVATLAALHSTRRPSKDGPGSKWHGCCVLPESEYGTLGFKEPREKPIWRRIDFLIVPESEYGAALIYFTGNDIFNRSMRLLAGKKGMRLNQRGLYKEVMRGKGRVKVTEGELVEGRDEKRIFEILGIRWREPSERWC